MKKITINSVASYAGVSKKTVSRVLNNEPNVSDATREKVLKAFKELDYTPNPIARVWRAIAALLLVVFTIIRQKVTSRVCKAVHWQRAMSMALIC